MASLCAKIEEKLSTYLDGRLSDLEMAQVADHLGGCAHCAALLDRMAALDRTASESLHEFDDAAMAKLEREINERIATLPSSRDQAPVKRNIFALWPRYAAVAASVAVLFLAGRMAYKEFLSPTIESPKRLQAIPEPPIKLSEPAVPTDSASRSKDRVTFGETLPVREISGTRKGLDFNQTSLPSIISKSTTPSTPAEDDKSITTEPAIIPDAAVGSADQTVEQTDELQEISPVTKEKAETETRAKIPGVTPQMSQTIIVPPEEKTDAGAADKRIVSNSSSVTTLSDRIDSQKSTALKSLDVERGVIETGKVSIAKNSLAELYDKTLADYQAKQREKSGISSTLYNAYKKRQDKPDTTLATVRMMIADLNSRPEPSTPQEQVERLYLTGRAHQQIFFATQLEPEFAQAQTCRDSAVAIIDDYLRKSPNDDHFLRLKDELAAWRFMR